MRRDEWFAALNASSLEVTHSAAIDVDPPVAGLSLQKAAVKEPIPESPLALPTEDNDEVHEHTGCKARP